MKTGAGAAPAVELELDATSIAWLKVGSGEADLRIGLQALRAIEERLDDIEELAASGTATALVLTSGTENRGLADWAPGEIRNATEEEVAAWSREAQAILLRIEMLPILTAAALEGSWTGSAAELALAFDLRIAAKAPGVALGFPGARFDRVPAWGATVRLPRRVGLERSIRLLVGGEVLGAAEARAIGLIDRILPAMDFEERLARHLQKMASERVTRTPSPRRRIFVGPAGESRLLLKRASRRYLAPSATGVPPGMAARVTFELLARSRTTSPQSAFALETAAAARVMAGEETSARLYAEESLREVADRGVPIDDAPQQVALLGSDRTLGELAALLVATGAQVRIKGSSRAAATDAVARAADRIDWEVSTGRISAREADDRKARLVPVTGFGGFGTLDFVIAVQGGPEDLLPGLMECSAHVRRDCVLAVHGWVPPTSTGRSAVEPPGIVTLVYGLPADRFPLLEVQGLAAVGERTAEEVRRLARRTGATLVSQSGWGPSAGSRLLAAYFEEASRLLDEGATVAQVDRAAETYGFSVGPFRRMDALGADRAYRIVRDVSRALGREEPSGRWLRRFATGGKTFYSYRRGYPAAPSPDLPPGLSPDDEAVSALVRRRLLLVLIAESFRILEDAVVSGPHLLDVVALEGLGYPPSRGGLMYQAERMGAGPLLQDLTTAARRFGARFEASEALREMAARENGSSGGERVRHVDGRMSVQTSGDLDNRAFD